jgi:hypothetical protein
MNLEVQEAIDEIAKQFPGHALVVAGDLSGGAFVIVEEVPLGAPYAQETSWVGFHITHNCPYADTYPHFVRADLTRADNGPLGDGMTNGHMFPQPGALRDPSEMPPRPAIQVSRRSNRRDSSGIETPNMKLLKVLQWMRSR